MTGLTCRSPRGERGLKYSVFPRFGVIVRGRSPRGERGLKYAEVWATDTIPAVAPLAGSVD